LLKTERPASDHCCTFSLILAPHTAKDLIRKMLVVDAKARITMEAALAHPFMADEAVRAHVQQKLDGERRKRSGASSGGTAAGPRKRKAEWGGE